MKKVLVTGTAGFIGYHTAISLCKRGYDVVGIDNINDYYDIRLKMARLAASGLCADTAFQGSSDVQSDMYRNYRFRKMDITDGSRLSALFEKEGFDYVCHLAAQAGVRYSIEHPYTYLDSNITGTLNILEACRNFPVSHLLYASSSSVYGRSDRVPFREDDPADNPESLYAATKRSGEILAASYSNLYGIPSTGLRFFTVYGPWGRPDMAPYIFLDSIMKGEPVRVFNNGDMYRDFTYVDDIVSGVTALIDNIPEAESPHRIFNIGRGEPVSLMDFIREIETAAGCPADIELLPMQPGDVFRTWADTAALEKATGYRPRTDLKEGIKTFAAWYKYYMEQIAL